MKEGKSEAEARELKEDLIKCRTLELKTAKAEKSSSGTKAKAKAG